MFNQFNFLILAINCVFVMETKGSNLIVLYSKSVWGIIWKFLRGYSLMTEEPYKSKNHWTLS